MTARTAPCTWTRDMGNDESVWETTCGQAFQFLDGEGPWRNKLRYCGYCGKPLREVHVQKEDEDGATTGG